MGVTKWLLRKIGSINHERMNKTVEVIASENNKSKFYIKCDIVKNFITRGSGYTDYFRGNYINLTSEEKKTFFTAKSFYKFLDYMNDKKYEVILNNKLVFNNYFSKYIKRDWINLRTSTLSDFKKFLKNKDIVFAKIANGEGGHGISRIVVKDENVEDLYNNLIKKRQYLVEEAILQSDELNELNPNVVNSFRIVTIYKDGKVYLVNNALRINQDEANIIGCTNDIYFSLNDKGKIDSNVIDDFGNIYEEHPLTHKKFKDVLIPQVKEAFELVKKLHLEIPEMRYIGWDIAFTKDGVELVEGNEYPGYGLLQFYKLYDNKRYGHLKEVSDILGDEMENIKL